MILAQRYADSNTASRYPLDCHGQLRWNVSKTTHKASIELPGIPAGTILVPSLALLSEADYRFQFILTQGSRRWALHPVPCESQPRTPPGDAAVTTHIDCFHVHQPLEGAGLQIEITGLSERCDYLLAVTARELELEDAAPPQTTTRAPAPPAFSQMSMGSKLGPRICSPTCTAMVLAQFGKSPDLAELSAACFDPVSNLYGIWPLALRAASRAGCLGAVEVFDGWRDPQRILAAGLPVIASIRFAAGGLPGSPLESTSGHLVVVYGIDPGEVRVHDPAAPDAHDVPRTYDAASFGRAWFQRRGAAYILLP